MKSPRAGKSQDGSLLGYPECPLGMVVGLGGPELQLSAVWWVSEKTLIELLVQWQAPSFLSESKALSSRAVRQASKSSVLEANQHLGIYYQCLFS